MSIKRSISIPVAGALTSPLGAVRLPWDAEASHAPAVATETTPATIFPTGNLLWIHALGATYLRDGGGSAPSDGEAVVTAIDRGRVGDCATAAAGVTYAAAAFGGRGGLSFAGGASDFLTSPSWVLNGRCSGGCVWRPSAGTRALWGHAAVNTHTSLFRTDASGTMRRIDGTGGKDALFPAGISTTADHVTTWRLQDASGYALDSVGGEATSAVAVTIPTSAGTTKIGGLDTGVAMYAGVLGILVLWDGVATAQQLTDLAAWMAAEAGV